MLWLWWLYGGFVAVVLLGFLLDAFFGLPKLADLTCAEWDGPEAQSISVIVPALNEENGIEVGLRSLAAQDHGKLEIIAVNDRSTDATGVIMEKVAAASGSRIRVLHVVELPPGWLGKPHAMWKAASLTTGKWLLFTDGDVIFRPDAIRRAVTYAEKVGADHLSLLPTLITKTAGERMMISLFHFGLAAMRPWQSPETPARFAFGAGAFNMVRRSAYQQIGSFEALRLAVVEDFPSWGKDNDKEVEVLNAREGAGGVILTFGQKGSVSLLFDVPAEQVKAALKFSMTLRTVKPKDEQHSFVVNM